MRIWSALAVVLFSSVAFAQYTEAPVTNGGSISGKITYDGTPPKPETVVVAQDPATCGKSRVMDEWTIAADGGVENVIVYLVDIKSGKKMDLPAQPTIDQKGCRYEPHVQIIAKNSELQVKNSDPILHNIHSYLGTSTVINLAEPKQGMVIPKKITKAGGMTLKCDIHNFMRGAIFTTQTPYAVLTAKDGTYELKDVPPGTYEIATFHEVFSPKSGSVTVTPGGKATFNAKIK
ncbi:MAG: carboxypeptidase regulatory-like domain-containing protein [Myxococcaceae bacterium]